MHPAMLTHCPRRTLTLCMPHGVLLLWLMVAPADCYHSLSNAGRSCHSECELGARSSGGLCKTPFCGLGDVGCCQLGQQQLPCSGHVGCEGHQCCVRLYDDPPNPPAPMLPPPHPPVPLHFECDEGKLTYLHKPEAMNLGKVLTTSSAVEFVPWRELVLVTLLVPANGAYVDVMRIDGATLVSRDQEDSSLRLVFELTDEPADGCSEPCFWFDTVGNMPAPSSITCALNPEFVDPPPSPPPLPPPSPSPPRPESKPVRSPPVQQFDGATSARTKGSLSNASGDKYSGALVEEAENAEDTGALVEETETSSEGELGLNDRSAERLQNEKSVDAMHGEDMHTAAQGQMVSDAQHQPSARRLVLLALCVASLLCLIGLLCIDRINRIYMSLTRVASKYGLCEIYRPQWSGIAQIDEDADENEAANRSKFTGPSRLDFDEEDATVSNPDNTNASMNNVESRSSCLDSTAYPRSIKEQSNKYSAETIHPHNDNHQKIFQDGSTLHSSTIQQAPGLHGTDRSVATHAMYGSNDVVSHDNDEGETC